MPLSCLSDVDWSTVWLIKMKLNLISFICIALLISAGWYYGDTMVIMSLSPSLHLSELSVFSVIFPHSSLQWPQQHREHCSISVQPHWRRSGIVFDLQEWPVFIPPSSEDSGWPQRSGSPQRLWWDGPQISKANCTTEVIWSHFIKGGGRGGGEA